MCTCRYGVLVLLGEAMGASAVVLYGLCIIRRLPDSEGGFRSFDPDPQALQGLHYHIQARRSATSGPIHKKRKPESV